MSDDRRYLLARCLRLEARYLRLRTIMQEPRANPRRLVTESDIAEMCELRRQGMVVRAIARRTEWSYATVWSKTRGVCTEQESDA